MTPSLPPSPSPDHRALDNGSAEQSDARSVESDLSQSGPSPADPLEWRERLDSLEHSFSTELPAVREGLDRLAAELPQRIRDQLRTVPGSTAAQFEQRLEPLRVLVRRARDAAASLAHRIHDLEVHRRSLRQSLDELLRTVADDDPRISALEDHLARTGRNQEDSGQRLNVRLDRLVSHLGDHESRLGALDQRFEDSALRDAQTLRQFQAEFGRLRDAQQGFDAEQLRRHRSLCERVEGELRHRDERLERTLSTDREHTERLVRDAEDRLAVAMAVSVQELEQRALQRLESIEGLLTAVGERADSLDQSADRKVLGVERALQSAELRFDATLRNWRREALLWRVLAVIGMLALLLLFFTSRN